MIIALLFRLIDTCSSQVFALSPNTFGPNICDNTKVAPRFRYTATPSALAVSSAPKLSPYPRPVPRRLPTTTWLSSVEVDFRARIGVDIEATVVAGFEGEAAVAVTVALTVVDVVEIAVVFGGRDGELGGEVSTSVEGVGMGRGVLLARAEATALIAVVDDDDDEEEVEGRVLLLDFR